MSRTARLNELSTQLVALQAVAAESGSRQSQAQAGGSDRLQEVVNNPNLSALRADIARAEAKLQEINSRLGDNHPQVIEAKANIASLRSRLATETGRVTGSLGVSNSINRQREAEIRATLEAQRSRVMRMRTAREEGSVLLRDVEAAQRAYDAVAAKTESVESRGSRQRKATPICSLRRCRRLHRPRRSCCAMRSFRSSPGWSLPLRRRYCSNTSIGACARTTRSLRCLDFRCWVSCPNPVARGTSPVGAYLS